MTIEIVHYICLMIFSSTLLENAVNEFAKLPGIGKKTALRLVLHLLKKEVDDVKSFSEAILKMREEIHFCNRCHNIADKQLCNICADRSRKQHMICVVESIRDVIAIESTQQYNGLYHVLGGIISPLDGIGPDQLQIDSLIKTGRGRKNGRTHFCLKPQYPGRYHHIIISVKN